MSVEIKSPHMELCESSIPLDEWMKNQDASRVKSVTYDWPKIHALAEDLNNAHEELEADMQAVANDALHEGVLVVASFPEKLDLSWISCCSYPSRACERDHRPDPNARSKPKFKGHRHSKRAP